MCKVGTEFDTPCLSFSRGLARHYVLQRRIYIVYIYLHEFPLSIQLMRYVHYVPPHPLPSWSSRSAYRGKHTRPSYYTSRREGPHR
jgi:hypothetical protein